MTSLKSTEWDLVSDRFPMAMIEERTDGTSLVALPRFALPSGWTKTNTTVWFVVPVGYPASKPDCFWVEPDLLPSNGVTPANSGIQPIGGNGVPALWFSWHLSSWNPAHDDLMTYIRFIEARLRDVR